jgi:signal transduction histidine kinase
MRHRVEAAGGKLAVASAPGRGTRISAVLPAAPPVPAQAAVEATAA